MKLSVIICCYNEKNTVAEVIRRTQAVDLGPNWTREILVVDNASTDGTQEKLKEFANDPEIFLHFHAVNKGKGASIRTGIDHMSGDYMIIQDADFEYDPQEHVRFCRFVDAQKPAAVFGSRVLGGRAVYKYAHAYWGVRFLTAVANVLFGGRLTDIATATKMVRADVLNSLHLVGSTFDLDFELPCKILLAGHQIEEIPITYHPRTYEEGKKIKVTDGLRALGVILKNRLKTTPVLKADAVRQVQK